MTMSFETNAQQWIAQPSNVNPNNYVQFIDAVDTNVVGLLHLIATHS
ncbi:MAG: hypothetical protein R2847_06695 [Bacteroidia bacterium]